MYPKKKRLGRGLEALLGASALETTGQIHSELPNSGDHPEDCHCERCQREMGALPVSGSGESTSDLIQLSVHEIDANPFQPRREFSQTEIASLSESLKSHDMLQPILVRRVGSRFELISGERRLRAAIAAGWSTIPARIRQADDRLVAELAIVENLQRKDLNPIEKALSFRRYIDEHRCTQEELANRLKIDRSTLTNLIRLLELPVACQEALQKGLITAGHARTLLPLGEENLQIEFSEQIQREGWSVRQTETEVNEYLGRVDGHAPGKPTQRQAATNPQIEALQHQIKMVLGTKVEIKKNSRNGGKIIIHFANPAEFERIKESLMENSGQSGMRRVA
ncbi:MAG TPA: ParB/RepB/Spo0J family partition protein [Pirellulaceae bacterium]|nr:ParB/RepB/Spo0J family partition protein [Pirellulaceae bacterium]HMO92597.1 ParB/RepB/Spo0J family partition protein [Pirellulaceae bacterium]